MSVQIAKLAPNRIKVAEIAKLVPRVKMAIRPRHRNIVQSEGPLGRINIMRNLVAALFKYERIEIRIAKCEEVRGYVERLISEAIRHGDSSPSTMELADFWLEDKQMVHKLFKVLAPRYRDCNRTYTEMYIIPQDYSVLRRGRGVHEQNLCVLELRGNPYPPMPSKPKPNGESLTNILLKEASKDFRRMKLEAKQESNQTS